MSSNGECYVVLPPDCIKGTVILGRNAQDAESLGKAQEVIYYDSNEVIESKCDGGAEPVLTEDCLRLILQKPEPGIWGGDCGANERNVCMAITWSADEVDIGSGHLRGTDIVRFVLATATSASKAIDIIITLLEQHGNDAAKLNFVVCDALEAWHVSCVGKLLVAQRISDAHRRIPCNGLTVTDEPYDKTSSELCEKLKSLGSEDSSFGKCFEAYLATATEWSGPTTVGDSSYSLTSMFETLRSAAKAENSRSATVFVLNANGISCYWFTATPNAMESVFKPFVFAPNSKISPLTKVQAGSDVTLLHKLHGQRKSAAVEHLKTLESSCIAEFTKYLEEHPESDEELDELMKDCVEAEVKFYR